MDLLRRLLLGLTLSIAVLCAEGGAAAQLGLDSADVAVVADPDPAGALRPRAARRRAPAGSGSATTATSAGLDEVVAGETVGARKLVVRRFRTVEQVDSCHVLFICASEAGRLEHIHAKLMGRSVLTVGETKDFAARYGIVGFDVQRNRLKLRINVAAADSAKLTISSKLLRQAELVASKG